MHRLAGPIMGLVLALAGSTSFAAQQASPMPVEAPDTLHYNQITALPEGGVSVGYPVLSADGDTAVFTEAPGTGDPATPNRIFVIGPDGSGLTEVDAYQPLCFCGSMVDISADGSTVVSTEGVQVRIADTGGPRELVSLARRRDHLTGDHGGRRDVVLHRPARHSNERRCHSSLARCLGNQRGRKRPAPDCRRPGGCRGTWHRIRRDCLLLPRRRAPARCLRQRWPGRVRRLWGWP